MKIPECGLLELKNVGEYILCDDKIWMFVKCKCILLELPEQIYHLFRELDTGPYFEPMNAVYLPYPLRDFLLFYNPF